MTALEALGLDLSIIGLPLLAGLLVLATHVPLGIQVLDRGIVFIDLAIAQLAALGVVLAGRLDLPAGDLVTQASAALAALAGAVLLAWTDARAGPRQEAVIGVLFVLASCAGILLLASDPHGGEHLQDLLVGQLLWVDSRRLAWLAALTALLLLAIRAGVGQRFGRLGFYGLFALAVTASVQVVGVFLVFTSLIVPALATDGQPPGRRLATGYAIGAVGLVTGLALSALFDLPSGAVVVCALVAVAVLVRASAR